LRRDFTIVLLPGSFAKRKNSLTLQLFQRRFGKPEKLLGEYSR